MRPMPSSIFSGDTSTWALPSPPQQARHAHQRYANLCSTTLHIHQLHSPASCPLAGLTVKATHSAKALGCIAMADAERATWPLVAVRGLEKPLLLKPCPRLAAYLYQAWKQHVGWQA